MLTKYISTWRFVAQIMHTWFNKFDNGLSWTRSSFLTWSYTLLNIEPADHDCQTFANSLEPDQTLRVKCLHLKKMLMANKRIFEVFINQPAKLLILMKKWFRICLGSYVGKNQVTEWKGGTIYKTDLYS